MLSFHNNNAVICVKIYKLLFSYHYIIFVSKLCLVLNLESSFLFWCIVYLRIRGPIWLNQAASWNKLKICIVLHSSHCCYISHNTFHIKVFDTIICSFSDLVLATASTESCTVTAATHFLCTCNIQLVLD